MGLKATVGLVMLLAGGTCQGQSQGNAQKDPTTTTHAADVTLAGVDTSALTPREKHEWSSYVGELLAPCSDTPVPIAQCVQENRNCSRCLPAAKFVLKGVRDGLSRDQIEKAYHDRFDADKIRDVPIAGSPTKGPDSAPVTIVEFADFECPFCAMMAPQLEKTFNERPKGQIRFVYKFYPLPAHPHGELAARAAIAAWDQGKFWEMHDKLFANRDHLEQSDIDSYAKELGLDLKELHEDEQAQATTDRIAQDKKLGEALNIQGTPTIYINGRNFDARADMNDWLNLEVAGASAAPTPAPSPSAGGAKGADAGSAKSATVTLDAGKQK